MDVNKHDTYFIPHNYQDSGGIIRGAFKARNLAEGAVGAAVLVIAVMSTGLAETPKIITSCTLGLISFASGAAGKDNQPLSKYLFSILIFFINNRKLVYKEGWDSDGKANDRAKAKDNGKTGNKGIQGDTGIHRHKSHPERNYRNKGRPVRKSP